MNKQTNRAKTLKITFELIKASLDKKISIDDFKHIVDNVKYEASDQDLEAYLKFEIICYLLQNMEYYKIEDFLITLGMYVVKLANSYDGYNVTSTIINAAIREMLVDVTRRVETEVLSHLYEFLEMYYRSIDLFKEKSLIYIKENICDPSLVSCIDTAENYKYEQMSLEVLKEEKERTNELVSKTNYNRKENIRKTLRKYVLDNYREESLESFSEALNETIKNVNLSPFEKEQLAEKYKESFSKLYEYSMIAWMEQKEESEYQQLSLFNLNN